VDLAAVHGTGSGGRITHADVEAAAARTEVPRPGRVRSSPLARRLAQELGVPIATVIGSGPGGAVQARDIRRAATQQTTALLQTTAPQAATPSVPSPAAVEPAAVAADHAAAMRAQIARSMAKSKREIPHYYLAETIDLDAALRWLHACNRELPVARRIVPAALLLKAAALAVQTVPDVNGFFTDGHFTRAGAVHLGVAVSLRGGGLVAPAIHDADKLSLDELMAALKDLVARMRAGRLRAAELADPTITVSNLGEQGVEAIHGVIYPPQVALVGFGAIADRPWAVDGLLGVRPLVTASLAADHRVTDGATGARYLLTIRQLLQKPEEL
jgi:pyruvate dehydrogenase E2 component (dihydrolipoamide acetyltransferase)